MLAVTSQFNILTAQKKQSTDCHNGNNVHNVTCTKTNFKGWDLSEPTIIPYTELGILLKFQATRAWLQDQVETYVNFYQVFHKYLLAEIIALMINIENPIKRINRSYKKNILC